MSSLSSMDRVPSLLVTAAANCGREAQPTVLCSMEPAWLQCLAPTDSVYHCSTTTFPFPKHDPSALSPLIHPSCHRIKVVLRTHPFPPLLCISCRVPCPEDVLFYDVRAAPGVSFAIGALGFSQRSAKRRRLSDMLLHVRFLHDAVHLLGALKT